MKQKENECWDCKHGNHLSGKCQAHSPQRKIHCTNCDTDTETVYVISECVQEYNLTTKQYKEPEILQTLRTECECGQILSEEI